MRLLVLSASKAQLDRRGVMPAGNRYDHHLFRVIRKAATEARFPSDVGIFVFSGVHGLIPWQEAIPFEPEEITEDRARELADVVADQIERYARSTQITDIYLSLVKEARPAFKDCRLIKHQHIPTTFSPTDAIKRQSETMAWLGLTKGKDD